MAGLSGRAEWVRKVWCWMVRGSCDLLLAALGPNFIRAHPVLLDGGLVVRIRSGKPTVARARGRGH